MAAETPVAPVAAPTEIAIPADKQDLLKSLNNTGASLQRELGAITFNYDLQKSKLTAQFESNRQSHNSLLVEIAKTMGIGTLDQNQEWGFDPDRMLFIRRK